MSRSAKPQNGRRRFLRESFAQQAGWLPWVWRWGYNSNRTRIWRAVAPARSHKRERLASACVRCGQCVQACPYDTLNWRRWPQACQRARHILLHGISLRNV